MTALITVDGLARLDAALAYIEQHPEEHRQQTWAWRTPCGTAYCLAGHVAVQAGATFRWNAFVGADGTQLADAVEVTYEGRLIDVDELAMTLLGVEDEAASDLFEGGNTLADLRDQRDALAASLSGIQESETTR